MKILQVKQVKAKFWIIHKILSFIQITFVSSLYFFKSFNYDLFIEAFTLSVHKLDIYSSKHRSFGIDRFLITEIIVESIGI